MAAALPWIVAGTAGASAGAGIYSARKAGQAVNSQEKLAREAFERSRPAFDAAFGHYQGILQGGPSALSRVLGPEINANNVAFQNARRNLINNSLARGGGLTSRLGMLEGQKAMNMSNLIGTARNNAAAQLGNLAGGQQLAGLQALSGAAGARRDATAQNTEAWGNVGSFITRLLSDPALLGGSRPSSPSFIPPPTTHGGLPGYIPPAIQSQAPNAIPRVQAPLV
jgi:hypothetical protein